MLQTFKTHVKPTKAENPDVPFSKAMPLLILRILELCLCVQVPILSTTMGSPLELDLYKSYPFKTKNMFWSLHNAYFHLKQYSLVHTIMRLRGACDITIYVLLYHVLNGNYPVSFRLLTNSFISDLLLSRLIHIKFQFTRMPVYYWQHFKTSYVALETYYKYKK